MKVIIASDSYKGCSQTIYLNMNKIQLFLLTISILLCGGCTTAVTVTSPDENLSLTLDVNGEMNISITHQSGTLVLDSPVGIEFSDGYFGQDVRIVSHKSSHIVDDYDMYVGKAGHIHSESNEVHLCLKDEKNRRVEMFLRAFDDGVAYRYYIPEQDGMTELSVRSETMTLNTPGDPSLKAMILADFACSHENIYLTQNLSSFDDSLLFDMPALLTFPDGEYMAITEANVVDYAGMDITVEKGHLKGVLSPRLDGSGLCVTGPLPRRSPWRVFQVSDRIGTLLESNIITTLADPCQEQDLSWLNPGLATWPWWNCYQAPSELKKGDINTVNQNINRYYIDFCAENDIPYHSITGIVDEKGDEICWYYNQGSSPGNPGDDDDTSIPYPEFDIDSVCRYAAEKGVSMRVWVHWKTLDKNMEETFRIYNAKGIKGMMIDFMDRDDEEMTDFQKRALELAMKYHLHIQFHGASKPSGLSRTYPCEFTRENTMNYECYKWDQRFSGELIGSEHDLNIAFVRTLAGPADYHLGSFRAVKSEDFTPVYNRPVTTCTRSHSLALYITLQSALHLVSDAPEAYIDETGFEFVKNVPTVWDETRVLLAEPDTYLVIARRNGTDWYLGGIGNSVSHDLTLPLDFLGDESYTMTVFRDAADSDKNPNHIDKSESPASSSDYINIHLAPNGGFAAILTSKVN